jgi:outer membrane protein, adhesin transport system
MIQVMQKQLNLSKNIWGCLIVLSSSFSAQAEIATHNLKSGFTELFSLKSKTADKQVDLNQLSQFQVKKAHPNALPEIIMKGDSKQAFSRVSVLYTSPIPQSFNQTILMALQRSPLISESLANISGENSNIDVARAGYFPQVSGGFSTEDFNNKQGYGQVFSIDAKQMVFDFGKVKTDVGLAEAKLNTAKAEALVKIDEVAYDTAMTLVNIKRYQSLENIAAQQLKGLLGIAEITRLRAAAGISTQADPVQAESYVQQAEATLVNQKNQQKQYEVKLRTLTGAEPSMMTFSIPQDVVMKSKLFNDPNYNRVPKIIAMQAAVEVARLEKEQTKLSNYPTVSLKGSVSQAMNGKNPSNNEENGADSSIRLEMSSNIFQGGAISARNKSANYSELAAKSKVSAAYLEVEDELTRLREEVTNKDQLLGILVARKKSTVRTRELYQEQYKLGTRSAVDLLNAEQAIHSAAQEIENARYDIYAAIIKYLSVTGDSYAVYQLNNTAIQGFTVKP